MNRAAISVGASGLVFDSKIPLKILLIKREKNPYANKWSFPGGRLEFGETVATAIKREVLEETGYEIEMMHNNYYHLNEIIREKDHYIICSASGFILKGPFAHENIFCQFFGLDPYLNQQVKTNSNAGIALPSISDIEVDECIPSLHKIIHRILRRDFNYQLIDPTNPIHAKFID